MTTTTKTQPESIEHLYQKFLTFYTSLRPIDSNEHDTLAALAATCDLSKDKFIVTKGFKSNGNNYLAGDVYPTAPSDRAMVIKLCKTGYILPEAETKRAQEYTAKKGRAELVKNLYQNLQTARDNKTKTARALDAARLDVENVEGIYQDAIQELARIEADILKELE